jgi:hypothetical protein
LQFLLHRLLFDAQPPERTAERSQHIERCLGDS